LPTQHSSVRSRSVPGLVCLHLALTAVRPGGLYDTGAAPKPEADASRADGVSAGR